MKKQLILVAFVVAIALTSTLVVIPARAGIDSRTWLGSIFDWGTDDYYGKAVYGYEEGSTATLWVKVKNDYTDSLSIPRKINISEVIVGFDWNTNYTNTLTTRVTLDINEIRYFTVTFTVPYANTSATSNKFLHGYTIYVKHLNATGFLVKTMTTGTTYTSNPDFAIYSKVQMEAREKARLNGQLDDPSGGFNSTAAKILWSKADNETNIAKTMYAQGDFTGASTHYGTALSLKNQAYTTENAITGGVQDAQLALINAQAKSFEATANYLNGLSNMWVLIGVAAVLFAIGYIIRGLAALRKPVMATT